MKGAQSEWLDYCEVNSSYSVNFLLWLLGGSLKLYTKESQHLAFVILSNNIYA